MQSLLSVEGLSIQFAQESFYAVHDLSFSLQAGKTLALIGESGCGKSITARALMRLLPSTAVIGETSKVVFADNDLMRLSEKKMRCFRGRRVAMIFQDPMSALNPVMTVGQQVSEVLREHRLCAARECSARVLGLLRQVGIPSPVARCDQYPHELSGGLKQRVAIAMALAGEPELLIADEPTTALDVTMQAQILSLLQSLQTKHRMAILLVTHDLAVAQQMADDIAVMYAGHLVELATCADFFKQPMHPYSQGLFAALPAIASRDYQLHAIDGQVERLLPSHLNSCRFIERCEFAAPACAQTAAKLAVVHEDHQVRCTLLAQGQSLSLAIDKKRRQRVQMRDRELLQVRDLRVHFSMRGAFLRRASAELKAVDGVHLDLKAGKTLALVGESGCGKSTLGLSLLRLVAKHSGRIYLRGQDLAQCTAMELKKLSQTMQIIFQDPMSAMDPRMRVADIITEGLRLHGVAREQREARLTELLAQVGLPSDSRFRYPHEFSGGQQQRICIARALALAPKLLICDEPTSALDVSVQAQIVNLLQRLQNEQGLAYLFITHNMSLVGYLADDIAVMYLGRIVERGSAQAVLKDPQHPYTQALLASVPKINSIAATITPEDLPSPIDLPTGCHFHPRCPFVLPRCREAAPSESILSSEHSASCWLLSEQ